MTFATGQAVWRFPVAFQIFWSLVTIAFLLPNPGKSAGFDKIWQALVV